MQKLSPQEHELTLHFMAGHDLGSRSLHMDGAADSGLPLEGYGQETVAVRRGAVVLRACVAQRVVHALTLIGPVAVVLLNQRDAIRDVVVHVVRLKTLRLHVCKEAL